MESRFILTLSLFLFITTAGRTQTRESVPEKVNFVLSKFDDVVKPQKAKRASLEVIFTDFYTAREKLREHIQGPGSTAQGLAGQDYQSIRKRNEGIIANRDLQLKKLLSGDEFKKWQEEIEPSIRNNRGRR